MNRIVIASILLACGLSAQGSIVSPISLTSTEGNSASFYPFFTPLRYMQYQTDMVGTVRTIKGLSFRRDNVSRNRGSAVARALELSVWIGEGDFDKRTKIYANNYIAAPTQTLKRTKINAPSWVTTTPVTPAPFDLSISFGTPAVYSGRNPLIWEMAVWSTTQIRQVYPADSVSSGSIGFGRSRRIGGLGCVPTQQSSPMFLTAFVTTHRLPDRLRFFASAKNAVRSSPIVTLFGMRNPNTSIPTCGPATLFTDASFAIHHMTDTLGHADTGSGLVAPWHPSLKGQKIYSQAYAPDNTQPGWPVAISNGVESTIPDLGAAPGPYSFIIKEGFPDAKAGDALITGLSVVTRFDL